MAPYPPRFARHYTTAVNGVDAAIILVVLIYAILGWKRGFIAVMFELAGAAIALGVAFLLYRPLGAWAASVIGARETLAQLVVFVVLVFAITAGMGLISFLLVQRAPKGVTRSTSNRAWGVLPSMIKGVALAAVGVTLWSAVPLRDAARDVQRSALGRPMRDAVLSLEGVFFGGFHEAVAELQQALGRETVEGSEPLPFRTTDVQTKPALEERMLALVNRERARDGLPPLVMDESLRRTARLHSKDMLARGYFAHDTPEGRTPFRRMRAGGARFRSAGENLAFAMTLEMAHEGLMNSPDHRENILTSEFHRVGISAVKAGARGIMFTQDFAD